MSSPSIRIVGEPGKRSLRACSSPSISTRVTSAATPSSRRTRSRSASASGCDGQPSHHRSSTVMYLHPLDLGVLDRPVARARLEALDRIHGLHAGGHPAEDGVLPVEPRRGLGRDDEELAAVRVGAAVRHRERSTLDLVLVDLVLELVAGAARPGALRAAALNHEVRDHAVEDQAVVVAVAGQLHEVVDGLRGVRLEQLELDRAVVRMHRRGAHGLFVTSARSGVPRTSFPEIASATWRARSAGTSTKANRSRTLTLRTSSFSRWVLSTTALTTSAGSSPSRRPADRTSLA